MLETFEAQVSKTLSRPLDLNLLGTFLAGVPGGVSVSRAQPLLPVLLYLAAVSANLILFISAYFDSGAW